LTAADRWTWIDIVRRARLGRTTKGVAYLVATYADTDGSHIFPGIATVAVAAEVDYKTAKKALAELVAKGLLERVASRTGRRGIGDEYRLILGDDLQELVEVLSPAQFELAAEKFRDANRRSKRTKGTGNADPRPELEGRGTPAPVPSTDEEEGRGTAEPQNDEGRGTGGAQDGERESAVHNHDLNTTTTYPTDEDLRTAVTVPSDPTPDQDPDISDEVQLPLARPELLPTEPPVPLLRLVPAVGSRRWSSRGQDAIAEAMARRAAARERHQQEAGETA
jgi:DNA-binding MarR family transcriptional regulator